MKRAWLAQPNGMCEGIRYGIAGLKYLAAAIKAEFPKARIKARRVAHNTATMIHLKDAPVEFIDHGIAGLGNQPDCDVFIVSPHGESAKEVAQVEALGVAVARLTCPLVVKNHNLIAHALGNSDTLVVVIGHITHQEIIGYLGLNQNQHQVVCLAPKPPYKIAIESWVTDVAAVRQTTLSIREAAAAGGYVQTLCQENGLPFRNLEGLCFATTNRQEAFESLITTHAIDTAIIIGEVPGSSNTTSLFNLAKARCQRAFHMLDRAAFGQWAAAGWFSETVNLGITAGASVHSEDVAQICEAVEQTFGVTVQAFCHRTEEERFPDYLYEREAAQVLKKLRQRSKATPQP